MPSQAYMLLVGLWVTFQIIVLGLFFLSGIRIDIRVLSVIPPFKGIADRKKEGCDFHHCYCDFRSDFGLSQSRQRRHQPQTNSQESCAQINQKENQHQRDTHSREPPHTQSISHTYGTDENADNKTQYINYRSHGFTYFPVGSCEIFWS